jgi:hypothetical protein
LIGAGLFVFDVDNDLRNFAGVFLGNIQNQSLAAVRADISLDALNISDLSNVGFLEKLDR